MEEKNQNVDVEQLTKDTFVSMVDYLPRLIPTMETLIVELRGEQQEDTYELLDMAINGVNWIIEVYNATEDIINKDEICVETDKMDEQVKNFSDAYLAKDYLKAASYMEESILPFLRIMQEVANHYTK